MIPSLYHFAKKWSEKGSVWIYSDPHFDDSDCQYMDPNWPSPKEQIQRLKKYCHKNDTLVILGDIGNPEYLKEIRSYKVLIAGNHDAGLKNYEKYFNELYKGPLFIHPQIILSHEPVFLPFAFNIHGHEHNGEKHDDCHLNVAANVIGYKPVNLGDLIRKGIVKNIPSIHRLAIEKQKTEKNKRKTPNPVFSLFCSCGCSSGLVVNVMDGLGYVSFISSDFTWKQFPSVSYCFSQLKRIIKKEYYPKIFKELIIKENDLINFEKFLERSIVSEEPVRNDSHIRIQYEEDVDTYSLLLIPDKKFLPWKKYQAFDLVINKKEANKLREMIQKSKKK